MLGMVVWRHYCQVLHVCLSVLGQWVKEVIGFTLRGQALAQRQETLLGNARHPCCVCWSFLALGSLSVCACLLVVIAE
jgi:hypothetical protein